MPQDEICGRLVFLTSVDLRKFLHASHELRIRGTLD